MRVYIRKSLPSWPHHWTFSFFYSKQVCIASSYTHCYGLNVCFPQNFYAGTLIRNVMVFGGGAWRRQLGPRDGTLSMGSVLLYEQPHDSSLPSSLHAMWGHSKKAAVYKSGSKTSPESNHAGTLISDFQPPELWEINACYLNHPGYGILLQPLGQTKTHIKKFQPSGVQISHYNE